MAEEALDDLVADLAGEQLELMEPLRGLGADDWFRPSPSWGWDVRDTVAHLADTDELALDTLSGGPRSLMVFVATVASPADVTYWGVFRGRKLPGAEVLGWWERIAGEEREALRAADPDVRVPWGLGMRPASFVRARLMECWAHGLDIRAALGLPAHDTDRLRHVAWLATRALPYAFSFAGREPPPGALRVELTGPAGEHWTFGPEDAPNRISGPAGEYCRVFVQRLAASDAHGLVAEGEGAVVALEVARAFL